MSALGSMMGGGGMGGDRGGFDGNMPNMPDGFNGQRPNMNMSEEEMEKWFNSQFPDGIPGGFPQDGFDRQRPNMPEQNNSSLTDIP